MQGWTPKIPNNPLTDPPASPTMQDMAAKASPAQSWPFVTIGEPAEGVDIEIVP